MSDLVERVLAEEGNRGLGNVQLTSDRALERYSRAGHDGEQNLVDKAVDALENGDRHRARRYLGTASRLPFDHREGSHPLAWIVHMMLFNLVSDTVEAADAGDSRWLDVALDLLGERDETGRSEMRDVLATIDHDYQLVRQESRALRAAIAQVPEQPSLPDQTLDDTALAESALTILELCRDYGSAVPPDAG